MKRIIDWAIHSEGSTRSAALMRIGLVALIWAKWADDLIVHKHLSDGLWPLSLLFFAATGLAFIGYRTQLTLAATALCVLTLVYYVGQVRGVEEYTHHHTVLLAWACMWLALGRAGDSYSLDRWLVVRKAQRLGQPPPAERANLWALRLLALQASSIYFWGAISKCNVAFLSGARLAHLVMFYYSGSRALSDVPGLESLLAIAAVLTVLLEFALAFGLLWPRTRRFLLLPGLLLHAAFYVFLDVSTFSATMWVLYLAYLDPDHLHKTIDIISAPAVQKG